jgi:hypothetical protein
MKLYLFGGLRAVRRSATGETFRLLFDPVFMVAEGKAVMVCDVDVMEDVVLLVFAMAGAAILVLQSLKIFKLFYFVIKNLIVVT